MNEDGTEPVIVVSGLPRSGTSMMMRMLRAGGVELLADGIRTANEDNPHGYFEFEPVKALDKGGDTTWLADTKGKAVKIISYLLSYLPGDYRYKVIFMLRDLDEILASQKKMLIRRGKESGSESDVEVKIALQKHVQVVRSALDHKDNFEVLYVNYSDAIRNPRDVAAQIIEFLGYDLKIDEMVASVDPGLYRNRAGAN